MIRNYVAIKVNAINDVDGNPRRGWIVNNSVDGSFIGFVDEGFDGVQAIYSAGFLRDDVIILDTVQFVIPVKTYKSLLRRSIGGE